jgi:hypothetical protein
LLRQPITDNAEELPMHPVHATTRPRKPALALLAACTMLAAAPAVHAGKATVAAEDGAAVFEYEGENLRISSGDEGNYLLVLDGKFYVVSNQDGQTMVIDAGSMMKSMSAMSKAMGNPTDMAPQSLAARVSDVKATGRMETVAGIKGEIYEMTFTDENGKLQTEEVVLSKDPLAKEFRDALFAMSKMAEEFAQELTDEETVAAGRDLQQRLTDMDVGVLRVGREMTITDISGETVPAARFALPAEPMDMQGLGAMMGAAMQQAQEAQKNAPADNAAAGAEAKKSGGLFSGMMEALGGKAERQQDRVGDAVDNEVDQKTDEAVDNAIGKAFGKLFGRGGP